MVQTTVALGLGQAMVPAAADDAKHANYATYANDATYANYDAIYATYANYASYANYANYATYAHHASMPVMPFTPFAPCRAVSRRPPDPAHIAPIARPPGAPHGVPPPPRAAHTQRERSARLATPGSPIAAPRRACQSCHFTPFTPFYAIALHYTPLYA